MSSKEDPSLTSIENSSQCDIIKSWDLVQQETSSVYIYLYLRIKRIRILMWFLDLQFYFLYELFNLQFNPYLFDYKTKIFKYLCFCMK